LRPKPKPPSYDPAVAAEIASRRGYDTGRALELHNETGFTPKPLNVAKAVLYSLMPTGSVMKVPDSLWQSYLYASLMAGSALRGCRVLVIAPSLSAAPSNGAPQMARANGLMRRLVIFGHDMDDYMIREGGILRVGLYASRLGVGDIAGRMDQIVKTLKPWRGRVFRFDASVESVATNAGAILDSLHYSPAYLMAKDAREHPKLHLKANFFASPLVWDQLLTRPNGGILVNYIDSLRASRPRMVPRNARPHPASGRCPKLMATWCSSLMRSPPCPTSSAAHLLSDAGKREHGLSKHDHERRSHGDHFRHGEPGGRGRLRSALRTV
jgi:hypothetical protein